MPCEGRAEIAGDLTGGIFFSSQRKLIRREDQKRKFLCPVLAGLSVAYVTTPTKAGLSLKSLQRNCWTHHSHLNICTRPEAFPQTTTSRKGWKALRDCTEARNSPPSPSTPTRLHPSAMLFLSFFCFRQLIPPSP